MNNIFETVKVYEESWTVVESRPFNDEEKAMLKSVEITRGDYGLSACFTLVSGGKCYFQLSRDSVYVEGDTPNIEDLVYLRLERGSEECQRVL